MQGGEGVQGMKCAGKGDEEGGCGGKKGKK